MLGVSTTNMGLRRIDSLINHLSDTLIGLARLSVGVVNQLEMLLNDQMHRLGLTSLEQWAVRGAIWLLLLYGSIRLFRGAFRLVVATLLFLLLLHAYLAPGAVYS